MTNAMQWYFGCKITSLSLDVRFKPTELRHLLFNLADHATATALPFAKLAWDGMGSYNQSTSVSSIDLGGISLR